MSTGETVPVSSIVHPLNSDLTEKVQTKNVELAAVEDLKVDQFLPESANQDKRLIAFSLLLCRDSRTGRRTTFEAVAKEVGVSLDTLLLWSSKGGWRKRLSALDQEAAAAEQAVLEEFRRANRETELDEILRDGRKLRDAVRLKLNDPGRLSASELKSLSTALEVVSKTISQALGLDESGATAKEREEAAKEAALSQPSAKPSVIVFVGGSGAIGQPAQKPAVDV